MTHLPHCCCDDREAHEVAAMIAAGMGQLEASRIVYATDPRFGDDAAAWSRWVRREVRDRFAGLRKAVGM